MLFSFRITAVVQNCYTDSEREAAVEDAMKNVDFVFLVPLRYVSKGQSLAEVIKTQLGIEEEVATQLLRDIVEGKTKLSTLLILDGYDEYTPGTCTDIDKLLDSPVSKHFLLLTSRPGEYIKPSTRDKMDGQVIIEGFSEENIKKCSLKYLVNQELTDKFLTEAKESQIYELLHIPIILLMSCMVFVEKEFLPRHRQNCSA